MSEFSVRSPRPDANRISEPTLRRKALPFALNVLLVLGTVLSGPAVAVADDAPQKPPPARATGARFHSIEPVPASDQNAGDRLVRFRVEVTGENFGEDAAAVRVLPPIGAGSSARLDVEFVSDKRILLFGEAMAGSVLSPILLIVGGKSVAVPGTLTLKRTVAKSTEFEFQASVTADSQYENLYSIVLTTQDDNFSNRRNENEILIVPGGYTALEIEPASNPRRLVAHFVAAENFELKDVVATVYDGTDLDERSAIRVGKAVREFKADPNQPKIVSTRVLSLDRSNGVGRLLVEGSGFGKLEAPPISPEDLFRLWLAPKLDTSSSDSEHSGGMVSPAVLSDLTYQRYVESEWEKQEREKRKERPPYFPPTVSEQVPPTLASDPFVAPVPPAAGKDPRSADDKRRDLVLWRRAVAERVRLEILPRNPSYRVQDMQILFANDRLVDVAFSFSREAGYSVPFRLAAVTLAVKKSVPATENLKAGDVTGVSELERDASFVANASIGPKLDESLQYRYDILDEKSARDLFGRGVATNFYAVQLSVVNTGPKKVSIPLAAIQAEVEWPDYSDVKSKDDASRAVLFREGPPTLSPLPLAAVSGYFDAYQKTKGIKARVFNYLGGAATLGASLIPFFGPGFRDAHVAFTGGLIPGLRQAVGDLSGQQLQNLTALSWQSVEVVAPGGGSIERFVFIQRGEQTFNASTKGETYPVVKHIRNIVGVEVTGYEVVESEAKQAVPAT